MRLADFCGAPQRALAKTGALRQLRPGCFVHWTRRAKAALVVRVGRESRGCAAEALPAAETAEAEQGQPSKFSSGQRPALKIWVTATRR
ncbi:hypothetical protein B5E67_13325 [Faecalibacterium sp. An122]|nr:hypothetical protein B5E67_13325 [Faecalibacterium sp. An122]